LHPVVRYANMDSFSEHRHIIPAFVVVSTKASQIAGLY
jgi:hypothetical protein